MPKSLPIFLAVVLAVTLAALFMIQREEAPWTSGSEEALVEFNLGLEAQRRYYTVEAMDHYRKAVALDPDFAIARLFLLRGTRFDKNDKWLEELDELRERCPEQLDSTEAFLLCHGTAVLGGERYEAEEILETYLQEHPEDPFALDVRCDRLWRSEHAEEAELCYKELLEVEPNWVQAENRLGYLAMSQARFGEAEEHFRTYRYIAPDQANPHDSLAELLILLGRYEEAGQELQEAIAIRPDFCNSYRNLADMVIYTADASLSETLVDRAAENCGAEFAMELSCSLEFGVAFIDEDWAGLATTAAEACVKRNPGLLWLVHRAAVLNNELKLARKIEKAVGRLEHKIPDATQLHLKGVRLCAEGQIEGAISSFEGADRSLGYESQSQGMMKLFNRLHWAKALELEGNDAKAEKLIATVAQVNPDLAERYRRGDFTMPQP